MYPMRQHIIDTFRMAAGNGFTDLSFENLADLLLARPKEEMLTGNGFIIAKVPAPGLGRAAASEKEVPSMLAKLV